MLIHEYKDRLPVYRACELLKVSKSAYYEWAKAKPSCAISGDASLIEEIEKTALEFPGYGYRRITEELKRRGWAVNRKRILSLMRQNGLTKKKKRRCISTTDSSRGLKAYPNLAKDFTPSGIDEIWVADITYVRLRDGFAYLAAIIDGFSRKVVGWALRDRLNRELSLAALRMALARRKPAPGLIHHSDRGVQYSCSEYVDLLFANDIAISMRDPAILTITPWPNPSSQRLKKRR